MIPAEPTRSRAGAATARRWAPGLLFAATVAWLYRAPLTGGARFYYRDILQNYRPMLGAIRDQLADGRLPWWNPWLGLGQPLLANPNHLALHPATWLTLWLPLDTAIAAIIALSTFAALAGTWLLARRLGADPAAAFLSAVAFGLSGLFLSFGNLPNLLGSAAWLPLCLYATLGFWQRPTPWRALGTVIGVGLLCLCAEPATLAAYLLIGTALAWHRPEPAGAVHPVSGPARRLASGGGLVAAGALVGAVQWVPFLGLLAASQRGAGFDYAAAAKWSLPPVRLIETVLPGLFGDPVGFDPRWWWGMNFFPTGFPLLLSIYVGLPVLGLAAIAVWHRRRRGEAALVAVIGLSVAVALGLYAPFHRLVFDIVPGFDRIRYPIRFLLAAQLAVALLAGRGLAVVLPSVRPAAPGRAGRRLLVGSAVAAAILLGLFVIGIPGRLAARFGAAIAAPPAAAPVLADLFAGGVIRAVTLAAAVLVIWFLCRRRRLPPNPAAWLVALLITVDLIAASATAVPVETADIYRDQPVLVSFLRGRGTMHRVQRRQRPAGVRVRMPDPAVRWGYAWDRDTLSRATPVEFGIRMGFGESTDQLDLTLPAAYGHQAETADQAARQTLWCRSGVRWLLTYTPPADRSVRRVATLGRRSDPPIGLYELPCAVPRVTAVTGVRRAADPGRARQLFLDPGFDPVREVILEGQGDGGAITADNSPGRLPARVIMDAPGRIEVEVAADRSGYLVVLENRHPGWRARVDGEARPVLAANGLFLAVPVEAGDHRVQLTYRPRNMPLAWLLVGAGLVGGAWLVPRWVGARGRTRARRRSRMPLIAPETS